MEQLEVGNGRLNSSVTTLERPNYSDRLLTRESSDFHLHGWTSAEGIRLQNADGRIARLASDSDVLIGNTDPFYATMKRLLDVTGSLLAILLFAPVMIVAATLIKLSDWGPVFYVHRRVGQDGREFTCLKFRSMRVDAAKMLDQLIAMNEHSDQRTFKMREDPRITWVGKWLRRTSLDELPQLFNVLVGDMSLVGPRPPVPSEVALYSPYDLQRLLVKPGITCIWQVSGRSRIPFPQQLEMDLEYIRRRSLWLDVKLLIYTVPAVITADGAY